VEAVLTSGHIPAGMELFAAGDETQMKVIKRWIDESDVYMLILGGRYGSIEQETQKSYIQLEYEYAVEKGKPLFAVVIDENCLERKVRKYGTSVIEKEYPVKLKQFRELVCSKMVRFWSDPKDIKLAVMETIADFSKRAALVGWIPGSDGITEEVIEKIEKLTNENTELKKQLAELERNQEPKFNGYTFMELAKILKSEDLLKDLARVGRYSKIGANSKFKKGLVKHGIIQKNNSDVWETEGVYSLTDVGKRFLAHWETESEKQLNEMFSGKKTG
jgi:DNA-binding MarR family transcriptional regulator